MEINLAKYNEIMERLEKCVNYYERLNFSNNKYSLYLANGDILNIRFPKNHIPHLLGVKLDYLKLSNRFKDNMNAYECLKYFIDESYSFSRLVSEGKLNFNSMFSKNIEEKLSVFEKNINIRTDDMLYIVKYDSEKTYQLEEISDICDYYIVRRCLGKYIILGLIKSSKNENIMVPVTSRKYDNYVEAENFIKKIAKKQELTYCYLMKVENQVQDYYSNFSYKIAEKKSILDKVINFSDKYDATASVAKDFMYTMDKDIIRKDNNLTTYNILRLLSDNLKNGNVLDSTTISEIVGNVEINDVISNLIDVCNDTVCSTNNSEALNNYSKLNDENNKLKDELNNLKKQLLLQEEQNKELKEENKELKENNEIFNKQFEIYEEGYQKIMSLKNKGV